MNSSPEDPGQLIQQAPDIAGIEQAVPKFEQVRQYTTFLAEWAQIDGDLVVHFFPAPEQNALAEKAQERYWLRDFPQLLSDTAEQYFNATKPRLTASYAEELSSWYFRARGFALQLDPAEFIGRFFVLLDEALDTSN